MEFLQRTRFPRRLSPRVWLVSLPSALISFEQKQRLPRLPIGRWRFIGIPLIGAGLCLWACARKHPDESPDPDYCAPAWPAQPGVKAGLLVLAGAALLLRSLVLALYSLLLAAAAKTGTVTVEEPDPELLLGREHRHGDTR